MHSSHPEKHANLFATLSIYGSATGAHARVVRASNANPESHGRRPRGTGWGEADITRNPTRKRSPTSQDQHVYNAGPDGNLLASRSAETRHVPPTPSERSLCQPASCAFTC